METREQLLKQMWELAKDSVLSGKRKADYSSIMLPGISINRVYTDEAGLATVEWKVFLGEELKNTMGFGHGGALTTLIDLLTWNSLFADPMYWPSGQKLTIEEVIKFRHSPTLSRKINVRFARPVVLDKEYLVTAKVIANSAGGAFISGRIHDKSGKTYVFGIQDLAKITKKPTKSKL